MNHPNHHVSTIDGDNRPHPNFMLYLPRRTFHINIQYNY